MQVRYVAKPSSSMASLAEVILGDPADPEAITEVRVREPLIKTPMINPMSDVSMKITDGLTRRQAPTVKPWGEILVVPTRMLMVSRLIEPIYTARGIIVPVPKSEISPDLARAISRLGTQTMRYYDAPKSYGSKLNPPHS